MSLVSVLLFTLAIATQGVDETQPVQPASTEQVQPAKKVKEKKICRATEVTSSRMPRQKCKTASEWAKFDDGANAGQLKNMGAR